MRLLFLASIISIHFALGFPPHAETSESSSPPALSSSGAAKMGATLPPSTSSTSKFDDSESKKLLEKNVGDLTQEDVKKLDQELEKVKTEIKEIGDKDPEQTKKLEKIEMGLWKKYEAFKEEKKEVKKRYDAAPKNKDGKVLGYKAKFDEKGNLVIDKNNPITDEKALANNGLSFWLHTDGKYHPWLKDNDGKWAGSVTGGSFSTSAIQPDSKSNGSFKISGDTAIGLDGKISLSSSNAGSNNKVYSVLNSELQLVRNNAGNDYGPLNQGANAKNTDFKGDVPLMGDKSVSSGYKVSTGSAVPQPVTQKPLQNKVITLDKLLKRKPQSERSIPSPASRKCVGTS